MRQSRIYSPEYGYVAFAVRQCADYLRRRHPLEQLLRDLERAWPVHRLAANLMLVAQRPS